MDAKRRRIEFKIECAKRDVEFWTGVEKKRKESKEISYPFIQWKWIAEAKKHRKEAQADLEYWLAEEKKL